VLILTVVVVVAAVSIGPGFLPRDGTTETPEYAVDTLLPERVPAEGDPTIDRRDEPGVVLVDTAHSNRMDPGDIRPLLSTITAAGYEVDLLDRGDDLSQSLARADAFVVIDPAQAYRPAEAARVEQFVDRGGRLLLVGEPAQARIAGFNIAVQDGRLSSLASRFGFEFGEAYLYNMETNDGNHLNVFAEPDGASVVTSELSRTAFYTATTVQTRDGRPVLVAGPGVRSSRTDATGSYPIAAVDGDVLAIGDRTFLERGNFNVVDNERLVRNIVRFLVSGTKQQSLATYPSFIGTQPTVHYTGPALLPAAQLISNDLRSTGRSPKMAQTRRAVAPDRTDVLVTTFDYLAERGEQGTGVHTTARRVQVAGYESNATGIIIVRAPAEGYDLVIAADTPRRAEQAASMLLLGNLHDDRINDRTAVVRTDAAVRLVVVEDG
jgi:hypothetical protein